MHGYQQTNDAQVHFDLFWRASGAADQLIASADASLTKSDDGGVPIGRYGATFHAAAVPAHCDDLLVLRVKLVSGSAPFLEFDSEMTIP